jgi:hypothetical protein
MDGDCVLMGVWKMFWCWGSDWGLRFGVDLMLYDGLRGKRVVYLCNFV